MYRIAFLLFILNITGAKGLQSQIDESLQITTEQTETTVFVYASNSQLYPQTVKLELSLKGIKPKKAIPKYIIVPASTEKFQLAELVIPLNRSWGYSYKYTFFMGDVNAKHNDDFIYRLPYRTGEAYKIGQGYFGKESHAGENALDFDMDEGSTVVASRAGKVVAIREDSNRGCPRESCAQSGNYVRILHEDGTFADYYHLKQNGALVEPGDDVIEGQEIGLSGNTGWSSGPHLHFIVYRHEEGKRVTIPTLFKTSGAAETQLKAKETYQAVN